MILTPLLDQLGQPNQLVETKGGPPRRDHHKRVGHRNTGPAGRQRNQLPVRVVEQDPIFAPVLATDDQFKLTTEEGMVGVGYLETSMRTVLWGCNRRPW